MSIVFRAIIYWLFSTMSLRDSFTGSPAAGKVTIIGVCVCVCTFSRRATQQIKYLRFPDAYAIASSRTSYSTSDTDFYSKVGIASGQECIGTIFRPVGKMPRIQRSMHDAASSRSTAMFSTIPNHGRAYRSLMNMKHCTGTACLLAVLNGGAFTGF